MIIYLILGLLWLMGFERFTTKISDDIEWSNKERIFHVIAWPLLLVTFLWRIFNPTDDE
jgi:hypothetical protein